MTERWTKLGFVSFSHQIYDPLGFLLPVLLTSKLIIQACWALGLDWRDTIPPDMISHWETWYGELSLLHEFSVPRVLFPSYDLETTIQLHIFADASENAYCAVAYTRSISSMGINISFCMSRGKIAPLKNQHNLVLNYQL